jgi:hypothetical protein
MRNYIIALTIIAVLGFAAGAAQAKTFGLNTAPVDLPIVRGNPTMPSYSDARQVQGKRVMSIDPFSYPSAHSQMKERLAHRAYKKHKRAAYLQRKSESAEEVFSTGFPPPESDGYRISNPLGTVYCGVHGCWRD